MKQRNNGTHARVWNHYNRVQDSMLAEVFNLSKQQRQEVASRKKKAPKPQLARLPYGNA